MDSSNYNKNKDKDNDKDKDLNKQIYFIISTNTQQNQLLILTPKNYKRQFSEFVKRHQTILEIGQIQAIKVQIQHKIRQLAEEVHKQKQQQQQKYLQQNESHQFHQSPTNTNKKQYLNNNNNNSHSVNSPHFKSIEEGEGQVQIQRDLIQSSIEKVQINDYDFQSQQQSNSQKNINLQTQQDNTQFKDQNDQNEGQSKGQSQNQSQSQNQRNFQLSYESSIQKFKTEGKQTQKKQFQQQKDLTETNYQTVKKLSNQGQIQITKSIKQINLTQNKIQKKKFFLLQHYKKGLYQDQTNPSGHVIQKNKMLNKNASNVLNASKEKQKYRKQSKTMKSPPSKKNTFKHPLHEQGMNQHQHQHQFQQLKSTNHDKNKSSNLYNQNQKQLTHHMFFRLNQQQFHTSSFRNKSKDQIDRQKQKQIKDASEAQSFIKQKRKNLNIKYNSQVFNKLHQTQTQSSFNRNNNSKSKDFEDNSIEKVIKNIKNIKQNKEKAYYYPVLSKALVEDKKTCRKRCQKIVIQKQRIENEVLQKSRQRDIRKYIKSHQKQGSNHSKSKSAKKRSGQCQCCHYQSINEKKLSKQKIYQQKQKAERQNRQKRRLKLIQIQKQKQKNTAPKITHKYISNILSQSYEELFKDYHPTQK